MGQCSLIHSPISSVVYNHHRVLTERRRSYSILFASRPAGMIPTNPIRLVFAPCSFKGREVGILCTHKRLSSDPFSCGRTLLHTSHNKMNPGVRRAHFSCYLSKRELCQIQYQKPLRPILLTDVSTHKDNLSLFLIWSCLIFLALVCHLSNLQVSQ